MMENNSNELNNDPEPGDLPDDLDVLLRQYAHCTVPDDFLTEAFSRFDDARAEAVSQLQNWLAFGVAVGVVLSIAASLLWVVIFNFTLVSRATAALSKIGILTFRYLLEMWSQMPELGTGLMLGLWTIMFVCAAMLIKAFRVATVHHITAG